MCVCVCVHVCVFVCVHYLYACVQKEELLTAGQLQDKTDKDDLENELYDLRDEVSAGQVKTTTTNR